MQAQPPDTTEVLPTGPAAIEQALAKIDLNKLKEHHLQVIRSGARSKRAKSVHALNAIEGLQRNNLTPDKLMIKNVPVIPPVFRPFSVIGNSFVPGDANELYRDLFQYRDSHNESLAVLGEAGSSQSKLDLYDTVKALYGYGEPIAPKTKQRGVAGFLQTITGCHDDMTEILTRKYGWVLFKNLQEDTDVATVNPDTLNFEWQKPYAYIHYRYIGELFHFSGNKRIDATVTPDHKMWVKSRGRSKPTSEVTEKFMSSNWELLPAYKAASLNGRRWIQTSSKGWSSGIFNMPSFIYNDEAKFASVVGFWIAEGWIKRDNTVMLCQSLKANPSICDKIRDAVVSLGLPFTEERLDTKPTGFNPSDGIMLRWSIRSSEFVTWLRENCGEYSDKKFLSEDIRNWDSTNLQDLVLAYLDGDGSKRENPEMCNKYKTHRFRNKLMTVHKGYTTTSLKLVDGLTEIFLKLGVTSTPRKPVISDKYKTIYHVGLLGVWNTVTEGEQGTEGAYASVQQYDGHVHCCSVDNKLLITRRNGRTLVSGNSNPKFGFVNRKLLSKPQDSVARGTISVNPDLSLDEVGVPLSMAWTMYAPYIQRRLVQSGMSPASALTNIKDRTEHARRALDKEVSARPVIYSRAPSWHKFNVLAGRPKLIEGDTIAINPLVTTGFNADFDGDTMNLHVPSQDEAVQEAYDKLMPSKMLFSIRDQDKVVPIPKQELILGLYTANRRPAKATHSFNNEAEALRAIRSGSISLSDEVEIKGSVDKYNPLQ